MKKIILPFAFFGLISLIFSSCTKIMLYTYGVRDPKVENSRTLTAYARNTGMETDNLYAFRDTVTQNAFFRSKIGTPEISFYNKDGFLMKYKDEKKCNAQDQSLISLLDPKKTVAADSSHNIFQYITGLRTLNNKELNKKDFDGYDYYMIIYWAKFAGSTNKTHIPDWEREVRKKTGLKIKVIKVTADYMDFWHPDTDRMVKIYTRKGRKRGNVSPLPF
jgi:hypothetical protein